MEQIDVVAAVVARDDQYLVCLRPGHKRHGGLWEFPGGKVEEGETFVDAIERELMEELSLTAVAVGRLLYTSKDPDSVFRIHFLEVTVTGEPVAHEHDRTMWCSVMDMSRLPLAPTDREFAKTLEQ